MAKSLDVDRLEREVEAVYRDVAETPDGEFHFEMGRPLAERLGYPSEDLDREVTRYVLHAKQHSELIPHLRDMARRYRMQAS